MCNAMSYLLNTNLQTQSFDFFQNRLRVWAAIFVRDSPFFELVIFPCFLPNPCTRMCVSTVRSSYAFGKQIKDYGKTLVESWFGLFLIIFVLP